MMSSDNTIISHLSRDPVLGNLISRCQSLKERPAQPTVYEALLRSINFQQLSGASARSIHGRFLDLFHDRNPHPEALLAMTEEQLRSAGLSGQKSRYVQNTARFFLEHELMNFDWEHRDDEEIIHLLTRIKGVGRWTVEMILMFTLKRPDVLPLDDLVVRSSMTELYGVQQLKGRKLKERLLEIAEPWRPYRTTASLYLWQYRDTII